MAASNDLTTLDFNSVKENLKTYLKSQTLFQDYDFEASNINVLLDILAYNTNLNAFYLNMISNEMFLDTALQRDSIISHAKELNYLPRSFRSAVAQINISLQDNSTNATILIPRGTTFTGTSGNKNFTFSLPENVQAISTGVNTFTALNVDIYEGDYTADSYVSNDLNQPRYIITNKTVDTNSIRVTVIEDNGETTISYNLKDSLFDIDAVDPVYFLQAAENDSYEILFGDGVIGRPPKNNSIVLIEYRKCNGELPNGIGTFTADDTIGSATVTGIRTISKASGGAIPESISSIKFNAPRSFTTQERVVTAADYSTLLKANFSEINDVLAYGGEEFDPPQFGRVIIAVDLKNTDELPATFINKYEEFIRPRTPLAISPVFVKPEYTYVSIETNVRYNINQTALNIDDIRSLVLSEIQSYNADNLNGFDKTLRYSQLVTAIDNAQSAIVSNDTTVTATKFITYDTNRQNYTLDFAMALVDNFGAKSTIYSENIPSSVKSTSFEFEGVECFLEDDGVGNINIVKYDISQFDSRQHVYVATVGSVNYNTGVVIITDFAVSQIYGGYLKISVVPKDKDIAGQKRSILRVLDSDIRIGVTQVRV